MGANGVGELINYREPMAQEQVLFNRPGQKRRTLTLPNWVLNINLKYYDLVSDRAQAHHSSIEMGKLRSDTHKGAQYPRTSSQPDRNTLDSA